MLALAGSRRPFTAQPASEVKLQFFLGIILFVAVIGALDAPLPWPHSQKRKFKP